MENKLVLYDARYNLKTETDYKKAAGIFGMREDALRGYKAKKQVIRKYYYILENDTPISTLKKLYAQVKHNNEVWKVIEGSDDKYMVSNYGRFKRVYKTGEKFVMPYFLTRKKNVNKHKQFIKVQFKGEYKEQNVSRLVAYHFVDIYYENEYGNQCKAIKYKKYTYDDVVVYHKNELVYDNYHGNLEYLDRYDLAKKTAHKANTKGTIVAIDADTGEVIDYFRSTRHVAKHLPVSRTSVSDSLNRVWKTNIVGGRYIFKYDND